MSNKQFPQVGKAITTHVTHPDSMFLTVFFSQNLSKFSFYLFFSFVFSFIFSFLTLFLHRIVHSPNNALTISQEDIDKLISSQDDISCSDITRDREDANCDVYKNGDKQCELGVASYIEEDPERVVEVEMAEVEIESVENFETIENVQNTENTEIFENVENVEDNENTEISENISENDEIIAPEIKIIAPEVENSENTVEATVESLYENEDEYDVGYESDYTDSDPSENPPTSQDPTVTEEQVIATEETKVEVPVVSESVPEPVTETVSESVTDKKVEVTIAPVSVTEQTEINSDIPETNRMGAEIFNISRKNLFLKFEPKKEIFVTFSYPIFYEPVVAVETDAVAEIDVKKPKSEETSVKSAKSSNNSIWIALGVLAGICLIVVAIVFFQKKSYGNV